MPREAVQVGDWVFFRIGVAAGTIAVAINWEQPRIALLSQDADLSGYLDDTELEQCPRLELPLHTRGLFWNGEHAEYETRDPSLLWTIDVSGDCPTIVTRLALPQGAGVIGVDEGAVYTTVASELCRTTRSGTTSCQGLPANAAPVGLAILPDGVVVADAFLGAYWLPGNGWAPQEPP